MTSPCIHGFRTEQCASCRPCPHGLSAGGCGRCLAATATASRRRITPALAQAPSPQDHNGFQIFYAPDVNGWLYRGPDESTSPESYRSIFLARKAIDSLGDTAAVGSSSRKRNR